MYKKLFFIIIATMAGTACKAQVTAVVYDIETHMPIAGVTVFVNPKGTTTTDRYGRFFVPASCHSVTLTHVGYEKRVMYRGEVRDTVFMLPKLNVVDDVIIIGNKPKMSFDPSKTAHNAGRNAQVPSSGVSFDFFSIFQKKKKSGKEREKFNKLMKNYSK